jgi:hypothetical protein
MRQYIIFVVIFLFGFGNAAFSQISDDDFDFIKSGIEQNRQKKEERKQAELNRKQQQVALDSEEKQRRAFEIEAAEQSLQESSQKREVAQQQNLLATQETQRHFGKKMEILFSAFIQGNRNREQQWKERNGQILNQTIENGYAAIKSAGEANQQNLQEMHRFSDELDEFMQQQARDEAVTLSTEQSDNTEAPVDFSKSIDADQFSLGLPEMKTISPSISVPDLHDHPKVPSGNPQAPNAHPQSIHSAPLASTDLALNVDTGKQSTILDIECMQLFLSEVDKTLPVPEECDPLVRWLGAKLDP